MVAQTLEDSRVFEREGEKDGNVEGRGEFRRGRSRESGRDRDERTGLSLLICDLQYTEPPPPSFLFAQGPRRLCRLNTINDLIPVITGLIYRGGADLSTCGGIETGEGTVRAELPFHRTQDSRSSPLDR